MCYQRRCLKTLNQVNQDDGLILLNTLFLAALITTSNQNIGVTLVRCLLACFKR